MTARESLRADCANCFALCCTALAFERSAGFGVNKPAGEPCRNLLADFRCGIHDALRENGFAGCTVYDCFGAGQKVAQSTFGGTSWRESPPSAPVMFAAFPVMRDLHELLWFLAEAVERSDVPLRAELEEAATRVERMTWLPASEIVATDVNEQRARIAPLLAQVAAAARAGHPDAAAHRGADLAGARLAGARLAGADLRGAVLIAADLRGADLRDADLIGADLRDARLEAADLSTAFYLGTAQLRGARGDAATLIPAHLERPSHWS